MKSVDELIELFRGKGFRITPQRRVIFEFLAESDSHPTADEIYQHVLSVMPDVSRATVYNTVYELVELGELTMVEDTGHVAARYDTNSSGHHHLFCIRCHTLIDLDLDFTCVELPPGHAAGYQIVRHQVSFYGICPDCQEST